MEITLDQLRQILGYDQEGVGRVLPPAIEQWLSTLPQTTTQELTYNGDVNPLSRDVTTYNFGSNTFGNEFGEAPIGPDGQPLWIPSEQRSVGRTLGRMAGVLGGAAAIGTAGMWAPSLFGSAGGAGGAAASAPAAGGAGGLFDAASLAAIDGVAPASFGAAGTGAGAGAAGAGAAALGTGAAGSTLGSLTSYLPYGAAALSGIAGANASREAGQVQADAATRAADSTLTATRESNQLLRDMYNTSRADNQPWVDAGRTALSSLTAGTAPGGEFMQRFDASRMYDDPGYAFRLSEGEKSINRAASAGGRYFGGQTLKDLTRFGQDYASGEYGNAYNRFTNDQTSRFNRLSSLAGTGQTATRDNNAAGMTTATQSGQNTIAGANNAGGMLTSGAAARASGYVGATNALTGAVGQGLNYAQSSSLMDLLSRRG